MPCDKRSEPVAGTPISNWSKAKPLVAALRPSVPVPPPPPPPLPPEPPLEPLPEVVVVVVVPPVFPLPPVSAAATVNLPRLLESLSLLHENAEVAE